MQLVDIETVFASWAFGGLVGFSLVSDNVRPTPLGGALIALEVAKGPREAGLPPSEPAADPLKQLEGFFGQYSQFPRTRTSLACPQWPLRDENAFLSLMVTLGVTWNPPMHWLRNSGWAWQI